METDAGMEAAKREGADDNTPPAPGAMSNLATPGAWLDIGIVALAAFLRLAWLDLRPPHFDEGVNGWFVESMTATGVYQYDPGNFHGPLHFYILFIFQTLLGRAPWVLRLPLALASLGAVAFTLWGFRRFFAATACRWAALAMAISPGMVFYGRDAIHESWLVLFHMLTMWGFLRMWKDGSRSGLWALGMGIAGMILTKETWIIHAIAMGLAAPTLWFWEHWSPSRGSHFAPQKWNWDDACHVAATALGLIVFFYSGCLLDPAGLRGLPEAYAIWSDTGLAGASRHEKPWFYWFELMSVYEWPALLGVAGCAGLIWPGANRPARYLALAAAGAFTGYSIIAYKTPWCLISIIWPFFLLFGLSVEWARRNVDGWVFGALAFAICAFSLRAGTELNFHHYAGSDEQDDYAEPYVYVQTRKDIALLLDPLRWLEARDPLALHRPGRVIQPEHHPLRWLLADYTHITWDRADGNPEPMDAEWLLVDEGESGRIEDSLRAAYFKTPLRLRAMAPDASMLYLRAETFRDYFPGREPEFITAEGEILRELETGK